MIFFNVMNCILWSILCSLIRPNNGWLYHYNNKFMANRFGNVITAHHARNIAPVVYPRMNEDLDEVNMEVSSVKMVNSAHFHGSVPFS